MRSLVKGMREVLLHMTRCVCSRSSLILHGGGCVLCIFVISMSTASAAPGQIELRSGNQSLEEGFAWARGWAMEMVVPANAKKNDHRWLFHDRDQRVTQHYPFQEGSQGPEWQTDQVLRQYNASLVGSKPKPTIRSYWGTYAYPADSLEKGWWQWSGGRECFCTRDICHQAVAGHLLGLAEENWSMLLHFARGANHNDRNPHWPKWSYSFFGDPYYMDADWRELPAPLELGEKLYEQYLWSGNADYINNEEILTYHANLHSPAAFMSHQDVNGNGIADETIQLPTLWEDTNDKFIEAGDSLGCQYQALLAYAGVLEARGDATGGQTFRDKAAALRRKFHEEWFNPETQRYIRGFRKDGTWKDNWGHEGSFFMPMKLVTDQGPRTAAYLDFIFRSAYEKELNIEAKTYLPEVFYKNGKDGMGWYYLAGVMSSRNRYPEVAFTTISNTVCGLMGVRANAPSGKVTTLPHLTHQVPWVECDHIRIGTRDLKLRHDGRIRSTLTLNAGDPILWIAQFPGVHTQIKVDGHWQAARMEQENGQIVSSVQVKLAKPGQTVTAEVHPDAGITLLGDLVPSASSGTIQRDGLPNSDRPMMLAGTFVERGLSLRGDGASASFHLAQACTRFTAELGVDDSAATDNTVEFQFLIDDVLAYRSGPLKRGQRVPVDLSLINAKRLQIGVVAGASTVGLVADAKLHHGREAAEESAASVVAGLRMPEIRKDERKLPSPKIPTGFTIALRDSSDTALVSRSGTITPPEFGTLVNLTYKITSKDGSTAWTKPFTVMIPARTPDTALLAAKLIKGVANPAMGQTSLPLPDVPKGFTIRMVESSDPQVIRLDGSIHPAGDYHTITIVYEVTMTSKGSTARTEPITVVVPARDFALLDQIPWQSATADSGQPARRISYSGNALRLAGATYASGIGTHANSRIVYDLAGGFSRMEVLVGVDDSQMEAGSIQFEILGDGRSLAKTDILRGMADHARRTATMTADLTGVKQLELRVHDAGDGINSDHANWVNGKLFIPVKKQ